MNTIESISKAVAIFRQFNTPYALLHCTNVYPTSPELVRLDAIKELQENFLTLLSVYLITLSTITHQWVR